MNVNRQEARSATTRAKLVRAARWLFARHGYAAVATEQIARRAGVTRGALYHQFKGKEELFLAVYEQVEEQLTQEVLASIGDVAGPLEAMRAGVRVFLQACQQPAVQRIVLVDGPAVLGWERWREVAERHGLGLLVAVIGEAVEAGEIAPVRVDVLAHVLMGAIDAAALLLVRDPDASAPVIDAFERLLGGFAVTPARATGARRAPARRRA
jgi:AcrR family transcriptional regulator